MIARALVVRVGVGRLMAAGGRRVVRILLVMVVVVVVLLLVLMLMLMLMLVLVLLVVMVAAAASRRRRRQRYVAAVWVHQRRHAAPVVDRGGAGAGRGGRVARVGVVGRRVGRFGVFVAVHGRAGVHRVTEDGVGEVVSNFWHVGSGGGGG